MFSTMAYGGRELTKTVSLGFNATLLVLATIIGSTFPQVGSILGYVGGFIGLGLIYIIPISVYLKRYKLKLEDPQLVEALDNNTIKTIRDRKRNGFTSPKIVIEEKTPPKLKKPQLNTTDNSLRESLLSSGSYKSTPSKKKFYLM